MQAKKAMVRAYIFLKPLLSNKMESRLNSGWDHRLVIKNTVEKALFCQSVNKTSGPNKYNFWALHIIWDRDSDLIVRLIVQVIQLQYHSQPWRNTKQILLQKPNKQDCTLVKSYRVISLLNYLDKGIEKLV